MRCLLGLQFLDYVPLDVCDCTQIKNTHGCCSEQKAFVVFSPGGGADLLYAGEL